MTFEITEEEIRGICGALDRVYAIIGYIQGRADSYAARRAECKVLQFPEQKTEAGGESDKIREGKEEEQRQKNNIALKSAFYFNQKEIKKMPKEFQRLITIELPISVRRKPNGVYEARFRKRGYHISVSSKNFDKLKDKFFAALLDYAEQGKKPQKEAKPVQSVPFFEAVAARWLELKRPTIKPRTAEFYEGLFRANLFPAFAGRDIREIRQSEVQAVINRYIEAKPRTAVKAYQTLKAVFEFAVGEELLERSPMRLLKPPKYEEKNGVALTVAEEAELVRRIGAAKCLPEVKNALLFLLYTGIRRSELASALIEDGFISVVCSKVRKGYREKRRSIPITPMLARLLPEMELDKLRTVRPDALTQALKRLMPEHHLHELRHTFITRSQECGVAREVVSVWAGHAADGAQTSNVYTHFSREFMLREGQKVDYSLD